jgi:hypothetical protein
MKHGASRRHCQDEDEAELDSVFKNPKTVTRIRSAAMAA